MTQVKHGVPEPRLPTLKELHEGFQLLAHGNMEAVRHINQRLIAIEKRIEELEDAKPRIITP